MSFFYKEGPKNSKDLERILDLPERDALYLGECIKEGLSDMFRTSKGDQTLRPLQAISLVEAHDLGGAVILLPVGGGKTLVSFLMPVVLEAKRPLLLVPGKLKSKTIREFRELQQNWQGHPDYSICSYELLSNSPTLLDELKPDLIVCDESHKLKNKKAGCTKRVWKYWHKNDDITIIPMSGTLSTRSFFDWWHLQLMALPDGLGVLPYDWKEAELWSRALDEKVKDRAELGALKVFGKDLEEARKGFGKRLRTVPGIITSDTQDVSSSIYIEFDNFSHSMIRRNLESLTKKWELPDETEIAMASDFWRHSREIANGFYYKWVEDPPEEWREKRRICAGFIRDKLKHARKYETPSQITDAFADAQPVKEWLEIESTFKPKTEANFFSYSVLGYAFEKAVASNAILWYEHKAVGAALADLGMQVFGSGGEEINTGVHIDDASGPIAASIGACGEGFNLQKWDTNIVLNCSPSGKTWEQLIGRTHRFGQKSDTVTFKLIITSDVQMSDFKQAYADASYTQATTGQRQKLKIADIIGSEEWKD